LIRRFQYLLPVFSTARQSRRLGRHLLVLAGGAAGAGAQTLARGKKLNVPAETNLNFRLQQDLRMHHAHTFERPPDRKYPQR
jgi:hypothetical protein